MSKRILIVDDEPNVRLSYRSVLEAENYVVEEANSAPTGLEKLVAGHFDLAILDMRMPEMDGLDLLAKMRERGLTTPVVIITAYGDLPHAVRAVKLGAIDFLQKPLTPEQLRRLVEEVITRHKEVEPERRRLREGLHLPSPLREARIKSARFRSSEAELEKRSPSRRPFCGGVQPRRRGG